MTLTGRRATARGQADEVPRLAELFDAHHRRLFRLALRLAGDREAALDLVQETFVRASGRRVRLPADTAGAEAWLVRTLVNLCRDRWRRQRVRDARGLAPGTATAEAPDLAERAAVRQALASLPPRQRAVVVMSEIEGRTSREIGALLGIGSVTVRWHLAAARRRLRELLSGLAGTGDGS